MPWIALSTFVHGDKNIKRGFPCQDRSLHEVISGDLVIAALADGAGTAIKSDIGADVATRTAIERLKLVCANGQPLEPNAIVEQLPTVMDAVIEQITDHSQKSGIPMRELSCTLLGFVATPDWLVSLQIGDGFCVVRSDGDSRFVLVHKPVRGEFAGETVFVTQSVAREYLQVGPVIHRPRFVCLSSDGLDNVALDLEHVEPEQKFFRSFEHSLGTVRDADQGNRELTEWLSSPSIRSRCDDDRSMVLLTFQGAEQKRDENGSREE